MHLFTQVYGIGIMKCVEHTHGFRILSATLLISEILAANISKYAAHAIRKDRDNGNARK